MCCSYDTVAVLFQWSDCSLFWSSGTRLIQLGITSQSLSGPVSNLEQESFVHVYPQCGHLLRGYFSLSTFHCYPREVVAPNLLTRNSLPSARGLAATDSLNSSTSRMGHSTSNGTKAGERMSMLNLSNFHPEQLVEIMDVRGIAILKF